MTEPSPPANAHSTVGTIGWWIVAMGASTVLAVIGSVLIGLSPEFTLSLLILVACLSLLLLVVGARRSDGRRPGSFGVATSVLVAGGAALGLAQLVPFGREHANPAVTGEPQWATTETRELMVGACYGCHSNEVEWPWYSSVAPLSWAITDHVDEGRDEVNYSEFATDPGEAEETMEVIEDGSMPPAYFTRFGLHPEAKLTDTQKETLLAGLAATPGMSEGDELDGRGEEEEEED